MGRCLIVTGGATVPFVALLEEVTTDAFIDVLQAHGLTHLYLQCGTYHKEMERRCKSVSLQAGLHVEAFDFCEDLRAMMREYCRGEKGVRPAGIVMGHAGTGTISDAMEVDCALVIVANTTLVDNHQSAFAAEIASDYPTIIQGHLGNLTEAIHEILQVIAKEGLDELEPYEETGLPKEQQLTFIDEIVADSKSLDHKLDNRLLTCRPCTIPKEVDISKKSF